MSGEWGWRWISTNKHTHVTHRAALTERETVERDIGQDSCDEDSPLTEWKLSREDRGAPGFWPLIHHGWRITKPGFICTWGNQSDWYEQQHPGLCHFTFNCTFQQQSQASVKPTVAGVVVLRGDITTKLGVKCQVKCLDSRTEKAVLHLFLLLAEEHTHTFCRAIHCGVSFSLWWLTAESPDLPRGHNTDILQDKAFQITKHL